MKVISFSIFDCKYDWQFLFYIRGLWFNCAMAEIVYPEWVVHVSVERSVWVKYIDFFKALHEQYGVIVSIQEEESLCRMMLWRMAPIFESINGEYPEYVICRDADALVTLREAQAIREWVKSRLTISNIQDNPAHTSPIMGGLCGFKCDRIRDCYGTYSGMIGESKVVIADHGTDQYFLSTVVYKHFSNSYVCYSKPQESRVDPRWLSNLCVSFIGAAGCNEMETLRYLRSQGKDLSLNGAGKLHPDIFYWL